MDRVDFGTVVQKELLSHNLGDVTTKPVTKGGRKNILLQVHNLLVHKGGRRIFHYISTYQEKQNNKAFQSKYAVTTHHLPTFQNE